MPLLDGHAQKEAFSPGHKGGASKEEEKANKSG
jgi:hypothetical protein